MAKYRPHTIINSAMTLDGKIATKRGDSQISSHNDKIRLHKLRSKVDGILIGINTALHDDPTLNVRYIKGNNPIRIILDSNGRICNNSKILKTCNKLPTIIVVSNKISQKNLSKLKKYPLEIIVIGKKSIDIKKLLFLLKQKKINKLLIEGGGLINWSFLSKKLIDEIIITVSPYLVGGKNAVSLVDGSGFNTISDSIKLQLKKTIKIKNELILHYRISN